MLLRNDFCYSVTGAVLIKQGIEQGFILQENSSDPEMVALRQTDANLKVWPYKKTDEIQARPDLFVELV
jgi:hypothetical protein